MQTDIYLLRHGATPANLEDRFAGRTEEPLHAKGLAQIKEVAATLAGQRITTIFAGPLARTRQSAAILGSLTGAPVQVEEAFNEIAIPHWDGLTKDEIRARFGPEYPFWLAQPAAFRGPGCETLAAVQERAVAGLERIMASHAGQRLVVVSHLIVLRCLALHYLGRSLMDFRKICLANGELTLISRTAATTTITLPPRPWSAPRR
ncbi:MAG: phosphoglycerate mutase [Deltaproteobacteria bacterium CG23_combo_of_CG06-09_8_20_14_all_60_8]|nr:MAG: phosphoglycerate mutase [Deltaproteobacteria bacterium CG23_combo_of_CG06-09_8_20_14_all_60_8]